jgi:hypothetical protein
MIRLLGGRKEVAVPAILLGPSFSPFRTSFPTFSDLPSPIASFRAFDVINQFSIYIKDLYVESERAWREIGSFFVT